MEEMTRVTVTVFGSPTYEFRYEGWYVPGPGDYLNHHGRKFRVVRNHFYTSDPDAVDIEVEEIK